MRRETPSAKRSRQITMRRAARILARVLTSTSASVVHGNWHRLSCMLVGPNQLRAKCAQHHKSQSQNQYDQHHRISFFLHRASWFGVAVVAMRTALDYVMPLQKHKACQCYALSARSLAADQRRAEPREALLKRLIADRADVAVLTHPRRPDDPELAAGAAIGANARPVQRLC